MTMLNEPAIPSPIRWQAPSWGAIIAGTCVALAVMMLLGELCSGVGWGLVHAQLRSGSSSAAIAALAGAAIVTCIVVSVVALFAGGWTAGHLSKRTSAIGSLLHGVIVWALGTLLMEVIGATSLGLAIGGSMNLLGAALHAGMDNGANLGPPMHHDEDRGGSSVEPGTSAARSLERLRVRAARVELARAFAVLDGQEAAGSSFDARRLQAESGQGTMAQAAASATVDASVHPPMRVAEDGLRAPTAEDLGQTLEQARSAATQATSVASCAAYVAFFATVLGLVAAGVGGSIGGMAARRRMERAERAHARMIAHAAVHTS